MQVPLTAKSDNALLPMKLAYFLPLLLVFAACKSNTSPEEQAVDTANAAYEKQPSDSTAAALITAMDKYIQAKGYADSTSARYVLRSARISSEHMQLDQAFTFYRDYLVEYANRPDQADILNETMALAARYKQPELDQVFYKSFVTRFPQDVRTSAFEAKIENKSIAVDSILRFIGMNMFNDSTFRLNEDRAELYIEACEAAVMANASLPNAPEFLHRAAETARTLRNIPKAIDLYDWIIEKYPTHARASTSLFLKAFTYDNDLKDFEKAGKYYHEFLSKYPNDEFAESAKFLLENLGKSEEELKQMLEAKSKDNVQ